MNLMSSVAIVRKELEEAMRHEVDIMRHLLSSLSDECKAIQNGDEKVIDQVLEERLELLSSFDLWSKRLIHITEFLALEEEVTIPHDRHLCHEEALEVLQECIESDEFELISLSEQLLAMLKEVHNLNANNARLLADNRSKFLHEIERQPVIVDKPLPKTTLAVMDPRSDFEFEMNH